MAIFSVKDLLNNINKADTSFHCDLKLITNIGSISTSLEEKVTNDFEEISTYYEHYPQPKVTAGILTFNEERSIQRCLISLIEEVDEVIVLDSGSTDRTIDVVKSFNQVLLEKETWVEDFSYHRNLILQKASNDWVYFIDADNFIDLVHKGRIRRIIKILDFLEVKGVVSPTIIEHDNSFSQDTRRMFRKSDNIRFYGKVHEEPLLSNGMEPLNISVELNVYHDGYNPEIVNMTNKINRNIKLTQEMMEKESTNPKWAFFFARELYHQKRELPVGLLMKAQQLYESSSYKRYYVESVNLLCRTLFEVRDFKKLNVYLEKLEELIPNCSDIDYFRTMMIFFNLQMKLKSLGDSLVNALEDYEKSSISFISPTHDHVKNAALGIYSSLGDYQQVLKMFKMIQSNEIKQEVKNNLSNIAKVIGSVTENMD